MHPVGRLDADTSGLLLFSKDGQMTQCLLSPASKISRVYEANVLGAVDYNKLKLHLNNGVQTTDGTFPAHLLFSEILSEFLKISRRKVEINFDFSTFFFS